LVRVRLRRRRRLRLRLRLRRRRRRRRRRRLRLRLRLRARVFEALLGLAAEAAPAADRAQVGLELVAVEVGAAEDEALRHLQPLGEPQQHARLEPLGRLREALPRPRARRARVAAVHAVGGHRQHRLDPRGVGCGIDGEQ
jgi:hypothetical protein